jgi:DNA-binding transcriptional ArsR family regulator
MAYHFGTLMVLNEEKIRRIFRAIEEGPPEGMSYTEIARATNFSQNTVGKYMLLLIERKLVMENRRGTMNMVRKLTPQEKEGRGAQSL